MTVIWTIALREWRALFISPLAWSLLAAIFCITGYMLNSGLDYYTTMQWRSQMMNAGVFSLTDVVSQVLGNGAVLLLLLTPLLTMRLIADEKRQETWPALASSPASLTQIVLGKYLGLILFLLVLVAVLGLQPALLSLYGELDVGQTLSALLGLFLVAAAFGSIGLAASSATENPIVAAIITFGVLLMLWIAAWWGEGSGGGFEQVMGYISLFSHYEKFLQGVVSSADLVYFLILSTLGPLLAVRKLNGERFNG